MNETQVAERIMQSRVALGAYERSGYPKLSTAEAIHKAAQEIQFLQGLAKVSPDNASKIARLVERYQALKLKLQLQGN